MHASTVGLIYSTHTHHVSPQFHAIYDDYFETVPNDNDNPPANWEDIVIHGYLKTDVEFLLDYQFEDSWHKHNIEYPGDREPPDLQPSNKERDT